LPRIAVGSKAFPESWILGDAVAELVRASGSADAEHKKNLGGTEIAYQALVNGSIDVYPEYTGTIVEVILKTKGRPAASEVESRLRESGLGITRGLGFDDSYALATTRAAAVRDGLAKISDLAKHPGLRLGLTHEFLGRADGYSGLARRYRLAMTDVRGLQHELAYDAIVFKDTAATDIYTTDPQIEKLSLVLLRDDLEFFPRYDAVLLYRLDLESRAPEALRALRRLEGKIEQSIMTRANAAVALHKTSTEEAARTLLREATGDASSAPEATSEATARIGYNVLRHLELVGASLIFAIVLGVPTGILATSIAADRGDALTEAGVLQIPSLALLAFDPALRDRRASGADPIVSSSIASFRSFETRSPVSRRFRARSARPPMRSVCLPWQSLRSSPFRWHRPPSWRASRRARSSTSARQRSRRSSAPKGLEIRSCRASRYAIHGSSSKARSRPRCSHFSSKRASTCSSGWSCREAFGYRRGRHDRTRRSGFFRRRVLIVALYLCPHCGEEVDTDPDAGGGDEQEYIEDCPVCCRPNRIVAHFVALEDAYVVDAFAET
jgi:glycine betaine/choline ABC-type transport system substrate-binding protein